MAYCNVDDLKKLLPETDLIRLTDDAGAGAIDTAKAQEAIDDAAAEIDAHIGLRVDLPITGTIPPILGEMNGVLAVVRLYSRVGLNPSEIWTERAKNTRRLLERFAEGKVSLGVQPPPRAPDSGDYSGGIKTSVRTKIFTEDELDKF